MPRTKKIAFTRPEPPPARHVDAEFLRESRKAAGLSQDDLAYLIGVSTRTISRLETSTHEGSPAAVDLGRIADLLSVSLDRLFPKPK